MKDHTAPGQATQGNPSVLRLLSMKQRIFAIIMVMVMAIVVMLGVVRWGAQRQHAAAAEEGAAAAEQLNAQVQITHGLIHSLGEVVHGAKRGHA